MQSNITNCSACGGEHLDLEFQRMKQPLGDGESLRTHWATCPKTADPVMLMVTIRVYRVTLPALWEANDQMFYSLDKALEFLRANLDCLKPDGLFEMGYADAFTLTCEDIPEVEWEAYLARPEV